MNITGRIISLLLLFLISIFSHGQTEVLDSLKLELIKTKENRETILPDIYKNIAHNFSKINEYDSVLKYLHYSLPYFVQVNDTINIAEIYQTKGFAHGSLGNYDSSFLYLSEAINYYEKLYDTAAIAKTYGNIGFIYTKKAEYDNALNFTLKSLQLAEKINYKEQIGWSANCLGAIHWYLLEDSLALKYYIKSLELMTELNDEFGIARANMNIGGVYQEMKQYNKAISYYTQALQVWEKLNEKRGKSATLVNFGNIYSTIGDFEKSLSSYKKALEVAKDIGDKWRSANVLREIGQIYLQKNNYTEADKYFNEALILAKQIDARKVMRDAYKNLSLLDSINGDYLSAYKNYILFSQLNDSILSIEKQKQISELQTKYETEKKEKEIEILNKAKEIDNNKIIVQKTINVSIIIVLIILGIAMFLLFKRFKEKQRLNKLLENKNKEIQLKQTKIENQNKKLEQQAEKLHELDEVKSRFFTNISHEFRTPLTLIIGPIEQLLLTVKDKSLKESLNLMLRNAQKLLELINQLLEISKIEKGNVKLKFQHGNIKNEIKYIVEMFSSLASEKSLVLNFKTDNSDFNGYVDKEKFDKIIMNVLSNSFKHTKKGNISLSLNKSTEQGKIKITVSDTGIGIKKEKLPFIFDRFYQADNSETKETAGTGIGLSFTKELINLYKGEITVQSEPGKGTQFIINLPISLDYYTKNEYELITDKITSPDPAIIDAELTENQTKASKQEYPDKKPETILIVEDHTDLRKFISNNLSDCYNIIEASNGKEGIDKALKYIPNIIITDIMMPEVNGIELTRTLKANENTSHIPIVMLTAKISSESIIEGLETEADDYLTKPFNIKELQARINNLIKIRKKLQEKYHRSISVNPSEITTTSVDEQFISKLLKIVEENMVNTDFSVETLCDLAGMSRANIHKKLKSLLNQSATEFINSIRLKRAAQLIKQNAGNISEIAYDVGFNNLSYFSRAFKNHFKITPKEMMENKDI